MQGDDAVKLTVTILVLKGYDCRDCECSFCALPMHGGIAGARQEEWKYDTHSFAFAIAYPEECFWDTLGSEMSRQRYRGFSRCAHLITTTP